MNDGSNYLRSAPVFICLDHIDIVASMIRQRVCVDIWCRQLERDYLLINQVLNFVLEVDTIFSIVPDAVGIISTSLISFVELLIDIHGFGPYRVDVSSRSQPLIQFGPAFSKCSKVL